MSPEMCCCEKQSSWIFVYENKEIWGICDTHFKSIEHRAFVKFVINIETRKSVTPDKIFKEIVAR